MSFPFISALSYSALAAQYSSSKSYDIGQKGMSQNGSEYRLSKAGAALTNPLAAKINAYRYLEGVTGDVAETTATAIAVGDTTVVIADATNARAANYWKGGYLAIPSSGTYDVFHHIWKSDAEVANTYKLYLEEPFLYAYAAGGTIAAYPSPWANVKNAGAYSGGYEHFVCCIERPITSGYHFWGKVRGPHWAWITGTWPGAAQNDRDVCFWIDGTIKMQDEGINTSAVSLQRAGYLMYSGNYGDAMIMLQIE
jgi:hypothetical protein